MPDPLLQSFQIRNLTIRNRILSTAHAPRYERDGMPDERYQLYHEEKAKGGLGLNIFGGSSTIASDSPAMLGQINVGVDEVIPHLAALAEGAHRHGTAIMCQISHTGRRTMGHFGDWMPMIGPSPIRERSHRGFPKAMEDHDIRRVIRDFAAAARRCKDSGLDGIELLTFGHLLGQFMTPSVNTRDDAYGGDMEGRLRLLFEVLDAVRAACGDDFVVGLRMTGDEIVAGGLTAGDCAAMARRIEDCAMVDFLNINGGQPFSNLELCTWVPAMGLPSAQFLGIAGQIKQMTDLPVFHAGGIADLATARHAVKDGLVDMVGMTRAHIADPHLVRKLEAGEDDRIRLCVGMAQCVDRVASGLDMTCVQNAAMGREKTKPHVIPPTTGPGRRIVIVGGGPGGMEAARVASPRGHQVVLFEAADRLGGQINLAAKSRSRRQVQGIADWLAAEIGRLGVDIRYNTLADGAAVMAENPDVVVIATGGVPNVDFLDDGAEHVFSVWDVLGGQVKPSGDVVIYDDHGQHHVPTCAEFMADAGARVEIVTADRAAMLELGVLTYPVFLKTLYPLGVTFTTDLVLKSVRRHGNRLVATFWNEYTATTEQREADQIVVDHATLPVEDVYFELKPSSRNLGELDHDAFLAGAAQDLAANPDGAFQLFRIGDALSSRGIHAAIYDALRLCVAL